MQDHHEINTENPLATKIADSELHDLLERLHEPDQELILEVEPVITVSSVVEATGMSQEEVLEALEEIRAERLNRVLNELEEPLFRVERAAPKSADPFDSAPPLAKIKRRKSIIDDLPRVDLVFVNKKKRSKEDIEEERSSRFQTNMILLALLIVMVLAIVIPMIRR